MSNKPDARHRNSSSDYLRELLRQANLTQAQAAKLLGITDRTMRYYLSDLSSAHYRPAPYVVQYALEQLAII